MPRLPRAVFKLLYTTFSGKAQWAAVLKDLESATDPGVRGGEAFLLAKDVAAIAELAEWR